MYVMLCVRPDICFIIGIMSRYQSNLSLEHWKDLKHILKYLWRMRDYVLVFLSVKMEGWNDGWKSYLL